jgi:hypothetical protein
MNMRFYGHASGTTARGDDREVLLRLPRTTQVRVAVHAAGRPALENVQEDHARVEGARQSEGGGEHRLGEPGAVEGNENSLRSGRHRPPPMNTLKRR